MKLDREVLLEGLILFILWMAFQIMFTKFMRRVR